MLDALDYLHTFKSPIIHRDIKPQNIKLNAKGKIKLLDFGIAKDINEDLSVNNTAHKTFVGATFYYSPIEQIIRIPEQSELLKVYFPEKVERILRQASDARSDSYALGATLYHLLTNKFPKPAHVRAGEIWSGKGDSLQPLHLANPEIPLEISNILAKALEVERESRFSSAKEMEAALQKRVSQEKQRKKEEEKRNMLAEQAEIKREREELAEMRRKLAEEREQHHKNDAETERQRREERDYETKLKEWQSANVRDKVADEAKPITATQPSITQPAPEKTKDRIDTLKALKPPTAPIVSAPTKPEKKKTLWILPLAIAGIFILGIAALGIFLVTRNSGGTITNKPILTTQPTISLTIAPTPTSEPSISPSILLSVSPTNLPVQSLSNNEKPKPTVAPTTAKTPAPNPVKIPTQTQTQKTPKPRPTRDAGCVYNGDC